MKRPRNGKQTEQTDTATELPEVRSEAGGGGGGVGGAVERDPPAKLSSTWSQRASLRKRALLKRPLGAWVGESSKIHLNMG